MTRLNLPILVVAVTVVAGNLPGPELAFADSGFPESLVDLLEQNPIGRAGQTPWARSSIAGARRETTTRLSRYDFERAAYLRKNDAEAIARRMVRDVAHNWIRENCTDAPITFLTYKVSPRPSRAYKRMSENEPLDATVSGRMRMDGREHGYSINLRIEGIDQEQAVFVVTRCWLGGSHECQIAAGDGDFGPTRRQATGHQEPQFDTEVPEHTQERLIGETPEACGAIIGAAEPHMIVRVTDDGRFSLVLLATTPSHEVDPGYYLLRFDRQRRCQEVLLVGSAP